MNDGPCTGLSAQVLTVKTQAENARSFAWTSARAGLLAKRRAGTPVGARALSGRGSDGRVGCCMCQERGGKGREPRGAGDGLPGHRGAGDGEAPSWRGVLTWRGQCVLSRALGVSDWLL